MHRLLLPITALFLLAALPAAHAQPLGDPGAEAGDGFGSALARGDFNNDGHGDLAIGVPTEDVDGQVDAGAVEVLYGNNGLQPGNRQFWSQNSAGVEEAAEAGDRFGTTLAVGDFNGDGFDDLAIGVPYEDLTAFDGGGVNVLYGSATRLSATAVPDQFWSQNTANVEDAVEAGDRFGAALAVGDFNNNGTDDLAIGVPYEDLVGSTKIDVGAVNVLYGHPSGLSATHTPDQIWHQDRPSVEDTAEGSGYEDSGDLFGSALTTGDFNGDGFDDLAIGVPFEDVGLPTVLKAAGAVNVLYGYTSGLSATGVPDQFWYEDRADLEGVGEAYDRFGQVLAAGDFNGDGRDDLAVGNPSDGWSDSGAVNVVYGASAGLSATAIPDQRWAGAYDDFGAALAAGDFNIDGRDDLAIGAPAYYIAPLDDAGAVHVTYGSATGLSARPAQLWHQDSPHIQDNASAGDRFGAALAAGSFNDWGTYDSPDDLAIGVYLEDLNAHSGPIDAAGGVNVIYGSYNPTGLSESIYPDQFWTQTYIAGPGLVAQGTPPQAGALPAAYALEGNHPNPFGPSTELRYALPEPAHVRLTVYDGLGRAVAVLVDERREAGAHAVRFEAGALPAGVYLYRIEAGPFTETRRMLRVR